MNIVTYLFTVLLAVYLSGSAAVTIHLNTFYWSDYIPGYIQPTAWKATEELYIGQVNYNGNLPATIYPYSHKAIFDSSGKKVVTENIKILCINDPWRLYWEFVNFNDLSGAQMNNAIKGGYLAGVQEDAFIGKAFHEDEWKIGRVMGIDIPKINGLWIWDKNSKTVGVKEFYLLKHNDTIIDDANNCSSSNNNEARAE